MKYKLKRKNNSGVFVCAVYIAVLGVFFAVCVLTFNTRTGLHPALVTLRDGRYFYVDLLMLLSPVFSLVCVAASRIKPYFAALSPTLLCVYTLYAHSVDKTLDYTILVVIPCLLVMLTAFITLIGVMPSGIPAFIAGLLCGGCYIVLAFIRVPQLFYYMSAYDGSYVYISKLLCHIILSLTPGILCLCYSYENTKEDKGEYKSIVEGELSESDALNDETALNGDEDILK